MLLFFLWGLFWSSENVHKPIKQYFSCSCNGVTIFAALPKICFYTSTFQYFFSGLFCSYLQINFRNFTNFCFPENLLVAAANRFKVLKIFMSLKVTVYIQYRRLRSKKALDARVLNGNLIVLKWQNIHVISNIKYTAIYI